ncbi:MFS transporter [Methanogenium sp. MK-MG]|uniref:MFS transporter n=1 Tax=Methanogenium sp. MK-MG TaxID=2599926 RepID=UPI0013EB1F42|nr:MFS transporter [Methanogenium sp. MK-MG]KAF1077970.1 putative multidrug resistance protein MdtD [Methanogenium sp. MK-MG]
MKSGGGFRWGVLTIICMAVFIMVIDTTIMNVSITALVSDLNTDVPTIQAIIAIYALVMASFMLIGGKLQDVIGRKKAFLIGVGIYGIGTFTASMSWNATSLLIGWAIFEGLGAILMMPATTTFLTSTYAGRDRAFAFGMWGGIGAAGAAFGPIIGGYLTTYYSWRWAFRLELLVVVIILIFSYLLSESAPTLKWRELDFIGTTLTFFGLGAIVTGILLMKNVEAWSSISLIIGAGLLLMAVFWFWQKHRLRTGKNPLVDVNIFRNRTFTLGNGIGTIQNIVIAGFLFIIPVFLQSVTGVSAFETGLALLPMSVMIFIFSIGGARLSAFLPPKWLLLAGLALAIAGVVAMRDVFSLATTIPDIIPGSMVFGIGIGTILSQITNLTLSAVDEKHSTDAAGVLNTLRQLGTSLGTALIGAILLIFIFSGLLSGIAQEYPEFEDSTNEELATILQSWVEKMQTTDISTIPEGTQETATRIADQAISAGMYRCFDAMAILLVIAFLAALALPGSPRPRREEDKK